MRSLLLLALPVSLALAREAPTALEGAVRDWDGTRGLIALLEVDTPFGPYNLTSGASIDASGRFAVPLDVNVAEFLMPARDALRVAGAESTCRDEVRIAPAAVRAQQFQVAVHDGRDHLGRLERLSTNRLPPQSGDVQARLVYADRAATLRGAVTCPSGRVEHWNVALEKGWNWLTLKATPFVSGYPSFEITNGSPERARWYRYGEIGALDLAFGEAGRVTRVGENARRAGVRTGDRLVRIGELYLDEIVLDAAGLLAPGEPGEGVQLMLERGGRRFTLTVPRDRVRVPWP